MVMPCLRVSQPKPPPRVKPAIPVVELMPTGVAKPCRCVAASRSASVAPASTYARFFAASTRTCFICEKSMVRPPLQMALPAMLCPAPRTEISSAFSRANLIAGATSCAIRRLHDDSWTAIDHGVPNLARFVVTGIVRA